MHRYANNGSEVKSNCKKSSLSESITISRVALPLGMGDIGFLAYDYCHEQISQLLQLMPTY